MIDARATALLRPALDSAARRIVGAGIGADTVTLVGFAVGLLAAGLIAAGHPLAGAIGIVVSRLLDGLDGAVARQTRPTARGGFLDISLDFVFYASIPLAFAVANPVANALAAVCLLAAFVANGTAFLAYAVTAGQRGMTSLAYPDKSFYFLGGLAEATESLVAFLAMCVWPQYFALLADGFAVLCAFSAVARLAAGWQTFDQRLKLNSTA